MRRFFHSQKLQIMKHVLLLVATSLLSFSIHAQFQKTFGSPNGDDMAYAVLQTSDGGFALAGYTETLGVGDDVLVMKLDDNGDVEWARAFGGGDYEEGKAIVQTPDEGFAIGATGSSYGAGGDDFYLIKTDASGNLEWFKTFGGQDSEYFEDMTLTPDGGFILIGTSLGMYNYGPWDIFLVKTDADGNLEWSKIIDLTGTIALGAEEGFAVDVTADGGYILSTEPEHLGVQFSGGDVCLIKVDSLGEVQWFSKAVNNLDADTEWDFGYSVHETTDEGYIVGGTTATFGTATKMALHRMDQTGALQWSRFYDFDGRDMAYSCLQRSNGGFAIAGGYDAFTDTGNVVILTTDDLGNPGFIGSYGGDGDDFAWSIHETFDLAFVMAGRSNSFSSNGDYDVYLLKTDFGGSMKNCPQQEFHLIAQDSIDVELYDPELTIDVPDVEEESAVINNIAVNITEELVCPVSTEIVEPLVENEVHIPSLIGQGNSVKLQRNYEYRVFGTDGKLHMSGNGNMIPFDQTGLFLLVIENQLFKIVVVKE